MAAPSVWVVAAKFLLRVGWPGGAHLPRGWGFADVAGLIRAANAGTGSAAVFVVESSGWDGAELGDGLEVTAAADGRPWRWRVDGEPPVSVVLLERDAAGQAGPWAGLEPRQLVDVFARLEKLLGVPWADGTGHTAERLILATHPRERGGVLLDTAPVVPEPARAGNLEQPYSWRRPLTARERGAGWVHVFDANAQYLSAWGTAELGHGVPVHHDGPGFDPKVAGLWRVPGGLDGLATPATPLLPAPWTLRREWYTTPTMVRALEAGLGLDFPAVVESWRWPRRSRFFRGAAERLRDARAEAAAVLAEPAPAADADDAAVDLWARRRVCARAAADAVKALYAVHTGRLLMARAEGARWYRPDWAHTVKATARVNLHRRLAKIAAAPFTVNVDALAFADDEPDAAAFAARVGLPVGTGLGQFKHEATMPAGILSGLETGERARDVWARFAEWEG